jgi:3-phenylpropionate/cinnamic acid dioxygenase small subunit
MTGDPMKKHSHWRVRGFVIAALWIGAMILSSYTAISNEKNPSIENRLRQLEDREEIRRLLMDYGRYLDQRDFASFSALFAEKEGEWIGGMGKAKSSESIRKLMEDTIGSNKAGDVAGPNRHMFTNEVIDVNGNQAKAKTKWVFWIQNNSKQPQPFYLGHYDDTLIREKGHWKFLKRIVYGDIPVDDPLSRK